MQTGSPASSHWLLDFLYALAIPIAGGIGVLVTWFLNRKKRIGEVQFNEAGIEKTRAEARHLHGETLNLAWERIDELQVVNSKLRMELDLCEIRGRFNEQQQKKLKALLDVHGIKYSEFDEPKT